MINRVLSEHCPTLRKNTLEIIALTVVKSLKTFLRFRESRSCQMRQVCSARCELEERRVLGTRLLLGRTVMDEHFNGTCLSVYRYQMI